MKRILLSILLLLTFASPSWATTNTFTVVSGSNWSTVANWSAGHVPANGEDVVISGNVTWDIATVPLIPATGSLATITSSGAFGISVAPTNAACGTLGNCAISFTTSAANGANLFTIASGTGTPFVSFNGSGGNTCTGSIAGAYHCIYHNQAGATAHVNVGLVGAASTNAGCGIKINANGALTDTYQNITGGGYTSAYGLFNYGNSTSVVTVHSGVVSGGGISGAVGIHNAANSAAAVVISPSVTLVNTTYAVAIDSVFTCSGLCSWNINGVYLSAGLASDAGGDLLAAGSTAAQITAGTYFIKKDTGTLTNGSASAGGGGCSTGY